MPLYHKWRMPLGFGRRYSKISLLRYGWCGQLYRYINGIGQKASRYNEIVVSRIVIKGFYYSGLCNTYENELSVDVVQPLPASP